MGAVLLEALDMEANRVTNFALDRFDWRTGGDAARQVRDIGGIIAACLLDNDRETHHVFQPARLNGRTVISPSRARAWARS